MSDNSFGRLLRVTTWGESHGPAIGCVIDGFPPGFEITEEEIRLELLNAGPPAVRGTPRSVEEKDEVRILSGMFEGRTTGTPISLFIENTDAKSKDYSNIAAPVPPRPCRLYLLEEVRHPRLPRRRALLGA